MELNEVDEKQIQEDLLRLLETFEPKQMEQLKKYGRDFGFVDYSIRARAYMLILGITEEDIEGFHAGVNLNEKFEVNEIIQNDSNRSFVGYQELKNLPEADLLQQRKELSYILHYFFRKHKQFSYYQGLHSFAELFLLVFGKALGYLFLEKLALKHLRKYLSNVDFEKELNHQVGITLHILRKEVPEVREIFGIENDSEQALEKLGFIVSWIVTWFSHKMSNLATIFRLFDYLVCSPAYAISLVSAMVVRESIRVNGLKSSMPLDHLFIVLYNMDMDALDWKAIIKQVKILEQTEDYSSLEYSAGSGGKMAWFLGEFKGRWNKVMTDQSTTKVKDAVKRSWEAGLGFFRGSNKPKKKDNLDEASKKGRKGSE